MLLISKFKRVMCDNLQHTKSQHFINKKMHKTLQIATIQQKMEMIYIKTNFNNKDLETAAVYEWMVAFKRIFCVLH